MNTQFFIQTPSDVDPIALANQQDSNRFRKQILYAGDFKKDDISFSVTPAVMDRWAELGNRWIENGVGIPMPDGHTSSAASKRADVLQFTRGVDSKGRDAIFAEFSFVPGLPPESQAALKASDVSVFVPEFQEVAGEKVERPISHVAFTNDPVIKGMDGAVALSFAVPMTPAPAAAAPMPQPQPQPQPAPAPKPAPTAADILKMLGLAVTEADLANPTVLKSKLDAYKKQLMTSQPAVPPAAPAAPVAGPVGMSHDNIMVSMTTENRGHKIEALLTKQQITPAQATQLKNQYCNPASLCLSWDGVGKFSDGFDDVVKVLETNTPLSLGGKTGPQKGSNPSNSDQAAALEDVNRRRVEAGLEPLESF